MDFRKMVRSGEVNGSNVRVREYNSVVQKMHTENDCGICTVCLLQSVLFIDRQSSHEQIQTIHWFIMTKLKCSSEDLLGLGIGSL